VWPAQGAGVDEEALEEGLIIPQGHQQRARPLQKGLGVPNAGGAV
jgi:hypothetical protein